MVERYKRVSQQIAAFSSEIGLQTFFLTFDLPSGDPTPVSVVQVDEVLTQVLSLMAAHFGQHRVKWFIRLIGRWP